MPLFIILLYYKLTLDVLFQQWIQLTRLSWLAMTLPSTTFWPKSAFHRTSVSSVPHKPSILYSQTSKFVVNVLRYVSRAYDFFLLRGRIISLCLPETAFSCISDTSTWGSDPLPPSCNFAPICTYSGCRKANLFRNIISSVGEQGGSHCVLNSCSSIEINPFLAHRSIIPYFNVPSASYVL